MQATGVGRGAGAGAAARWQWYGRARWQARRGCRWRCVGNGAVRSQALPQGSAAAVPQRRVRRCRPAGRYPRRDVGPDLLRIGRVHAALGQPHDHASLPLTSWVWTACHRSLQIAHVGARGPSWSGHRGTRRRCIGLARCGMPSAAWAGAAAGWRHRPGATRAPGGRRDRRVAGAAAGPRGRLRQATAGRGRRYATTSQGGGAGPAGAGERGGRAISGSPRPRRGAPESPHHPPPR